MSQTIVDLFIHFVRRIISQKIKAELAAKTSSKNFFDKKLEIEKTKPTFITSVLKVENQVVLVSSISNFVSNKISHANEWRRKKYLLAVGQLYKMRKIHCNLFTFQLRNNALISLEIAFTYFNKKSNVVVSYFFHLLIFLPSKQKKN